MNIEPYIDRVFRLESVAEIQYYIRVAVIEDDENAALWLDSYLADKAPGYRLAALYCAQILLNTSRRV